MNVSRLAFTVALTYSFNWQTRVSRTYWFTRLMSARVTSPSPGALGIGSGKLYILDKGGQLRALQDRAE